MKGMKFDSGKPRWSLLPLAVIEYVVRVLTLGAEKYDDDNWKKVSRDRYFDAAMRHITAYQAGRWLDESGLPALAHAICSLIFVFWHELKERGLLYANKNKHR